MTSEDDQRQREKASRSLSRLSVGDKCARKHLVPTDNTSIRQRQTRQHLFDLSIRTKGNEASTKTARERWEVDATNQNQSSRGQGRARHCQ